MPNISTSKKIVSKLSLKYYIGNVMETVVIMVIRTEQYYSARHEDWDD